MLTNVSQVETR